MPAHYANICRSQRLIFFCVGGLTIFRLVSGVIKLDDGDNTRILVAHHEISTHAVDAIRPRLIVIAFLDSEQPRKLNLGKDDMFRQSLDEPEIKDLLGLGKRFFGIKRPHFITGTALRFGFQDGKNNYHGNDDNQQQNN